jgi:acyl-CoA synthetase (NDP forming)
MSIEVFFNPRGVAVIGSTADGKIGLQLTSQLLEGGYREVYVVNPKGQGALTAPGFKSLSEIDPPVDLAVIVSPASTVKGVLEDCGRAGVRSAIIITAGFSETGNWTGEQELISTAQQNSIRFIGPNCAGIINTHNNLYPTLEARPPKGEVAFISQSGALGGAVLAWAAEQGLGFSKFVSYGNGADLNEIHFLNYLADDPETKVVALYIESVSDGRAFIQAIHDLTQRKPLVVIKSGRSHSGQRAALSHTGSMAGQDEVYDAVLREYGAIRVKDVLEMFDLCRGFVHLPAVRGSRLAIVTNSGGPGVLAADEAERAGLSLPEPSAKLRKHLVKRLPEQCSLQNPFDLTVEGKGEDYRDTLLTVAQEYDAALALNICPPYLDAVPLAEGVCAASKAMTKPLVANFVGGKNGVESCQVIEACGVPNYTTGERAVAVLARMVEHTAHQAHCLTMPEVPPEFGSLPDGDPMLEPQVMQWLRENEIPTADFQFACSLEEAISCAHKLGFPVAMKVVAPDVLHKSDIGGVFLDIEDESGVRDAFGKLQRVASGKDFKGVIFYPMVKGALEVLVGLYRDSQFGPVVVFGLGGIYTEVLHDIALKVAPVDHSRAAAMIKEIRSTPLLQGARGGISTNLETLADLLVRVSRLPFLYPDLLELDLNPVFLTSDGPIVGDARVIRQNRSKLQENP